MLTKKEHQEIDSVLVKEFYITTIDMRGPDHPNAEAKETGTVCILRFDDGAALTLPRLAALFNQAAKDFPSVDPGKLDIETGRLKIKAPPPPGYTKLPSRTIGFRG